MRPSQGFWGTRAIFFWGTGEQRPKNKGNRGTQAILVENQDFVFGEQVNKAIFSRGTREQVPPPPPRRRASQLSTMQNAYMY